MKLYCQGARVLNQKVLNVPMWGGGFNGLGLSPKKYQFFYPFPKEKEEKQSSVVRKGIFEKGGRSREQKNYTLAFHSFQNVSCVHVFSGHWAVATNLDFRYVSLFDSHVCAGHSETLCEFQ